MFDSIRSIRDPFAAGKRTYERLVWGLVLVGCLALVAGIVVDARLAGTASYLVTVWVAMAVAFGYPHVSDVTLLDERDAEIHDRASGLTITVVCVATLSVVPALYVLDAGGYVTIGATLWGVIYAVSALGLLYGACYTVVSRRR